MKSIYYSVLKLNLEPVYEKRITINTAVAHFETVVSTIISPPPPVHSPNTVDEG